MSRRRTHEEHENHERWLVSYADFITLLFAFFVVMYATSSTDVIRHQEISKALFEMFQHPQTHSLIELKPNGTPIDLPIPPDVDGIGHETPTDTVDKEAQAIKALQDIAGQIQNALGDEIAQGEARIRANELWLEIELNAALLFPSGGAEPLPDATSVLDKVAAVLSAYPNPVRVEGFADDRPIATKKYPSNWELSAARAARVVRMLMQDGIDPKRLAAVGYGEFQPLADNQSPLGRSRNRRVILLVSRHLDLRHAPIELNHNTQQATPPAVHTPRPPAGEGAGERVKMAHNLLKAPATPRPPSLL